MGSCPPLGERNSGSFLFGHGHLDSLLGCNLSHPLSCVKATLGSPLSNSEVLLCGATALRLCLQTASLEHIAAT